MAVVGTRWGQMRCITPSPSPTPSPTKNPTKFVPPPTKAPTKPAPPASAPRPSDGSYTGGSYTGGSYGSNQDGYATGLALEFHELDSGKSAAAHSTTDFTEALMLVSGVPLDQWDRNG
jgi:hypothetical protein